jgi:hypothetical protein
MVGPYLHVWPIFSYVIPCFVDWLLGSVLASFRSTYAFFTCEFLSCFLVGFVPFSFLCLKGLVCTNYLLSCAIVGHCAPSLEVKWLIIHIAPRSCC